MTINAAFTHRKTLGRLLRDTRGITLPLVALALTALIGFTGLGVEAGLWYTIKRHDQSAADMAATAGAKALAAEYAAGFTTAGAYPDLCALAKLGAKVNGFDNNGWSCPAQSPTLQSACTSLSSGQMCVNVPPLFGTSAGLPNAVEVVVSQQQNTMFASLPSFNIASVTIDARAVAQAQTGPGGISCGGALAKTGTGVNISGGAAVDLSGCGIFSNSNDAKSINFQGASTTFTASSFLTAGNFNINGNPTITVPLEVIDTAQVQDPYACNPPQVGCAGKITFTLPGGNGANAPSNGGTLQPGFYKGPMNFTSGTTYLCPGVYYIDGEDNSSDGAFEVSGNTTTVQMWQSGNPGSCPNSGGINGVTIIASSKANGKAGGFDVTAGGTLKLSAPTSSPATGIPPGILFYQDAANADTKPNGNGKEADSTIVAGASSILTGTLYAPKTNVTFQGNSNSTCFIIIALTLTFNGGATLTGNQTACTAAGVTAPSVVTFALLE
jgi:Putative Flp pilus-assembly TadE/G-like